MQFNDKKRLPLQLYVEGVYKGVVLVGSGWRSLFEHIESLQQLQAERMKSLLSSKLKVIVVTNKVKVELDMENSREFEKIKQICIIINVCVNLH